MSEEKLRPVNKTALLSRIRGPAVYVDPIKGEVSSVPSKNAVEVPTTHWWGFSLISPSFSDPFLQIIENEILEMAVYFPDFQLYRADDGSFVWLGRIEGIGEIRISYPQSYPSQKFSVEALDQPSSFNDELKKIVWSYGGISPAGSLIVLLRFFLSRKFGGNSNAMV